MATDTRAVSVRPTSAPELGQPGDAPVAARRGAGVTVLVVTAAALAFLLVGGAVGMLIALPRTTQGTAPGADSVDVGFAQDMSLHHLQGITMANWARDHTTDASVRTLAFEIESTQRAQVGMMAGWLTLWNQPTQRPPGRYQTWMVGSPAHGHGAKKSGAQPALGVETMPGMATDQEFAKLRSLSGAELDVYFLQLVLRHHIGGAPMVRYAALGADQGMVRALADGILNSQAAEVVAIKSMLAERGAPLSLS